MNTLVILLNFLSLVFCVVSSTSSFSSTFSSESDRSSPTSSSASSSSNSLMEDEFEYEASWESLDERILPDWYDDAKFGIFIHWGVYSVPAWAPVGTYSEWYWYHEQQPHSPTSKFHSRVYGPSFRYADFVPRFTAELFDADEWIDLIRTSGARYVVPTAKHHDGYALWGSAQAWNWNSVDTGPHRDFIQELVTAIRNNNQKYATSKYNKNNQYENAIRPSRVDVVDTSIHVGLYYSLYEFFHPLYTQAVSASLPPTAYIEQVMLPQLVDLVLRFQPDLLWSDGEWNFNSSVWQSQQFLAWLFNESPVRDTIVVNDRWGRDTRNKNGGFFTPEYDSTVYHDHKWELNRGIDVHSYGLNRATPSTHYASTRELIHTLVRCVSHGGNFLLNVGPAADGTIPLLMQQRLLEIGEWLQINGEAIYGTRMFRQQQEVHSIFRPKRRAEHDYDDNFQRQVGEEDAVEEDNGMDAMEQKQQQQQQQQQQRRMASKNTENKVNAKAVRYTASGAEEDIDEGVFIRYTRTKKSDDTDGMVLYAHLLQWPNDGIVSLHAPFVQLNRTVITMLGEETTGSLKYNALSSKQSSEATAQGVNIVLPSLNPTTTKTKYVWVLKITHAA